MCAAFQRRWAADSNIKIVGLLQGEATAGLIRKTRNHCSSMCKGKR